MRILLTVFCLLLVGLCVWVVLSSPNDVDDWAKVSHNDSPLKSESSLEARSAEKEQRSIVEGGQTDVFASLEASQVELDVLNNAEQEPSFTTDPLELDVSALEQEERSLSEVTAHMTEKELERFRDLRDQGDVVISSTGKLAPGYIMSERCVQGNELDACAETIIKISTNQTVFDGAWVSGYEQTGFGKEVVSIK